MTDLLPCPFCGRSSARIHSVRDGKRVGCPCGAAASPEHFGPSTMTSAEERAIAAWNTRAPAWRDISDMPESVKRDGTVIDAWTRDNERVPNVRWMLSGWYVREPDKFGDMDWVWINATHLTHWMPLPQPPEGRG